MPKRHPALRLGYEGVIARCRAPAADLVWLREFLTPCFEPPCEDDPPPSPEAEIGIERVDAAAATHAAGDEGTAIAAFAFEQGMQRLPTQPGGEGVLQVRDEPLGVVYRLEERDGSPCVQVLADPGSRRARVALMRLAREIVMNAALARREPVVHGAVVATGDAGTLFAGPKRAGKTTLLIQALRAGCDLVSNDRAVLVGSTEERPVARGVPTIVRIRPRTLEALPAPLRAPLEAGRLDHLSSCDEIARDEAPPRPRPGRPRNLSPAQLCVWLGASQRRQASLDRVLLLRATGEPGVQLRALSPEAAQARLRDCVFDASRPPSALVPLPARCGEPGPGDSAHHLRAITRAVPCHDFALGVGTDPDEISDALAAILS